MRLCTPIRGAKAVIGTRLSQWGCGGERGVSLRSGWFRRGTSWGTVGAARARGAAGRRAAPPRSWLKVCGRGGGEERSRGCGGAGGEAGCRAGRGPGGAGHLRGADAPPGRRGAPGPAGLLPRAVCAARREGAGPPRLALLHPAL